jgi:CubicO group peptidase (beta-lactamase class C family)
MGGTVGDAVFPAARRVVADGLAARTFPAATVDVGISGGSLWREAFGHLTYAVDAPAATLDSVFDLASLTKVLATTSLALGATRAPLELDTPLAALAPGWRDQARTIVTVRDALSHCTGLPAHRSLYRTCEGAAAYEAAICGTPLAYPPRTRAIYSDLGFILLGLILARATPLAEQFDALAAALGLHETLRFHPPAAWRGRIAPTEDERWRGRLLVGDVHDRNAWALGGAAGHAGLFGTAAAVGAFARHLLKVLDGMPGVFARARLEESVVRRPDVPGSSRALGWDTFVPGASCGSRLSPRAVGHTGFTGTSLWIDRDRGFYAVLLTNRVHPTAHGPAIGGLRAAFHDAVVADLEGSA